MVHTLNPSAREPGTRTTIVQRLAQLASLVWGHPGLQNLCLKNKQTNQEKQKQKTNLKTTPTKPLPNTQPNKKTQQQQNLNPNKKNIEY